MLPLKGKGFLEHEAEGTDFLQLLELVIHDISQNVNGTAPLSLSDFEFYRQALSTGLHSDPALTHITPRFLRS